MAHVKLHNINGWRRGESASLSSSGEKGNLRQGSLRDSALICRVGQQTGHSLFGNAYNHVLSSMYRC